MNVIVQIYMKIHLKQLTVANVSGMKVAKSVILTKTDMGVDV